MIVTEASDNVLGLRCAILGNDVTFNTEVEN